MGRMSAQFGLPHLPEMHWSKKLMWWLIGRSLDLIRLGTVFGLVLILGAAPFALQEYGRFVRAAPAPQRTPVALLVPSRAMRMNHPLHECSATQVS